MSLVESLEDWWRQGEHVPIELGPATRSIFVRSAGAGPSITLLHGFPSSSHDWAKLEPLLAATHSLLMPDFLGFGASEKPSEHVYSLYEQADLVEAIWDHAGVTSTQVIAHDYAVSVTEELLARAGEGRLRVKIDGVVFMNGGLYPELHRPQPLQLALLDPEQGPQISAMVNEELFIAGLAPTFAPGFDAAADSADIWAATHRGDGERVSHLLIRYITDREQHGQRWIDALEQTDIPLAFVWGMLDPVSGAHMAERIRERLEGASFLALENVSHWPALEEPEQVARAILATSN